MRGYAREVRDYLAAAGCYLLRRGKGDDDIWFSPITQRALTADHQILSRHTANGILKDAGIGKGF